MTDAIAERMEIFVRRVFAKLNPMLSYINIDVFAPRAE
jgi:hypothetical protein